MTFSTPELDLVEIVDLASRIGYDGIEPRIVSDHKHGIEIDTSAAERNEAKSKAAAKGILIGCVATSCKYADPATTPENIETTHSAIDLAADLGAKRIRVFGGQIGQGLDRGAAVEVVAKALSETADHAKERGVNVCMETHDDWCNPRDVAAVMARVNRSHIAVNWDVLHPVRTGTASIDESFEILKPWIKHVHVHDKDTPDGDLAPIGSGFVDHERAIEHLLSMDYDGFISGEWIKWSDPYEVHLPRELETLKAYENSLA